jgi:hypothetical protein
MILAPFTLQSLLVSCRDQVEQQLLSHLPPEVHHKLDFTHAFCTCFLVHPLHVSCRDQVEQQLLSHLPPEVQHTIEQARTKPPPATPAELLSAQLAGPRVSMQRWVYSTSYFCCAVCACDAARCAPAAHWTSKQLAVVVTITPAAHTLTPLCMT